MRASTLCTIGLLFGVALVGCSSDPCDGQSGTCVSARVEGTVKGLDQLRVTVGGVTGSMLTPSTPSAFSLPVKVALLLPASVSSPASITIDGLAAGQPVASSGAKSVSFSAGGHASSTFTLSAGVVGDGGAGDMQVGDGGVSDMGFVPPPGHVSAYPTTLNFPSTPRGQQSAPQTITLYNRTGMAVSTVPRDLAGTSGMGDDFVPTGVSPAGCMLTMNGISVPAGVDCQVNLVFAPKTSGDRMSGMGLFFSNGDVVNLTMKGTATPVWAGEVVSTSGASNTTLSGVWATTGFAVVVGKFSGTLLNQVAYTSTTPGQWMGASSGLGSGYLATVGGFDSTHVWAGGPTATLYSLNGTSWTSFPAQSSDAGTTSQAIEGIWMASSTQGWAVNGDVVLRYTSSWYVAFNPVDFGGAKAYPTAISGVSTGQYAVVGTNGYLAVSNGMATTFPSAVNTGSIASLRGVWMSPDNGDVFAVGLAATTGGPGTILHCSGAPFLCKAETSPVNGDLVAISGRSANGQLDLYAVGPLGNQVIHSIGNGTWTAVQVPNGGAMNAVSVAPDGEVFAVGAQGQVNHLY